MSTSRLLIIAAVGFVACGGEAQSPSGAGSAVALEWKAAQADGENVAVTVLVEGKRFAVGTLNAAGDDTKGTTATCRVGATVAPSHSEFRCGATPAYNLLTADVRGSELVVTRVTGVDGNEDSARRDEVKRIPVHGTALAVAAFTK